MVTLVSHPAESTDFAHWEFALLYPKDKQAAKHWDGTYRDRVWGSEDEFWGDFRSDNYSEIIVPARTYAKHLAAADQS